jgi:glycosyltransferase involved in cell wall biosynthesis
MENSGVKLSILICSLKFSDREYNLNKILNELANQISINNYENEIEILIEADKGELSVGEKRNKLINRSSGEYICFIDDDDFISSDYLLSILDNLRKDILLIRINHIIDGVKSKPIQTSLYLDIETDTAFFRCNHFHLCPVKSSIAKKVLFMSLNFAEDMYYSQKLVPLIDSYDVLENDIYIYNDNLKDSFTRNVF